MTGFVTPLTTRWGSRGPEAPLIVVFVDCAVAPGDTSDRDIATFARYLPDGAAYALVRLPLDWPDDGGQVVAWFRGWLDEQQSLQVPVVLVGFGGG
ncbi:MAG: hypothetical protein ACRDTX_07985, partial [Pseudonocardiaceae bacterium]